MNISLQNVDKVSALLTLKLEKADYQARVEKTLKNYRQKANIPGFRPGMVPMSLIKKQFGKSVLVEEVDKMMQEKVNEYIRDNKVNMLGMPLPNEEKMAPTMEETLDVEARSHVEMFHHFFFTLAPDDKYIRYTMDKAMYLVDETGLAQYNTLKEKGFYNNIMGTSAVFSIFCDSINFNEEKMEFTYYGRQRIERRTSILTRELVTAGKLKRVPRTDNNPHGLLIVDWRTLLNKDIEQKNKNNF